MDKCSQERIEISKGCHADANGIHQQRASKILPDDGASLAGDADGFNQLHKIIANQEDLRTFLGDVGA